MSMPLFVQDVKALGYEVECVCAAYYKLSDLLTYLEKNEFDLIAVDYIFPVKFLNDLKSLFPRTRVVTGGPGFLDTFLKSRIDFGIIGAGRESFLKLVNTLKNKGDLYDVPNLFLKIKHNNRIVIDYTGKNISLDLRRELFPYEPFLEWKYVGFRQRSKRYNAVSVVAEFGCPYRTKKLNHHYDALSLGRSRSDNFTDRAKKRINELFRERMGGGCGFCTYGRYVSLPVDRTVDLMMKQIRFLQGKYKIRDFSVSSEYPFRFIMKLVRQMVKEKIDIGQISIRSRVDWANKNEKILRAIVCLAKKHKFTFMLEQLGMESFVQKDLDVFNKGYDVVENFKVMRLIRDLHKMAPKNFLDGGHGRISLNPWVTLDDLKRVPNADWEKICLEQKLTLYDRCLPIYQKIKKEGLLVEQKEDLDTYTFKDQGVVRFLRKMGGLRSFLQNKYLADRKSLRKKDEYLNILLSLQKDIMKKIMVRDGAGVTPKVWRPRS